MVYGGKSTSVATWALMQCLLVLGTTLWGLKVRLICKTEDLNVMSSDEAGERPLLQPEPFNGVTMVTPSAVC